MSAPTSQQQGDALLELGGKLAGRLLGVSGGTIKDVRMSEPIGSGIQKIKHLSVTEVEPLDVVCGTGMSQDFYKWIGQNFGIRQYGRRSGAVIFVDKQLQPIRRLEFFEALVVGTILPALDKNAKGNAVLKVRIQPERIQVLTPTDWGINPGVYKSAKFKTWSVTDFRLEIDGLAREARQATKIGSIEMTQGTKKLYIGDERFVHVEPTKNEYPHVYIEVPVLNGDGFVKWHEAATNSNSKPVPKKGWIEYRAPSSETSYFALDLKDVGIFSLMKSGQFFKIALYCDSMSFRAGGSAIR
jgi:hypothetical protein